jgi:hypothetical protein
LAKGTKTGGRDFVKGDPRAGRPPVTDEHLKATKLTKMEAERILNEFMAMDIDALEVVLKDKKRKVIEHMVGRIALMAIKNGDHSRLNFLLERLIGKVSDKIEHTVTPRIVHNLDGGSAKFLSEGNNDE